MSKFLVILTGSPRGGLKTWNSLFKNIIDPLNADLAICFGNKFLKKDNFFLVQKATFDWTFEEPNNWSTYYQDNYSKKAIDFLISGSDYGMAGGIDDNTGSGAIVSALKDIIYKNHIEIIEDYDFIIHTRADQYYVDKLPEIKDNEILIPKGEDYFGICDRFILFNSKFAKSYFSLCNFLENAQDKNLSPDFVTPESVLLSHLKNENLYSHVKRIDRINFTVTLKNEHTRWRVAKYNLYLKNLMIKYPDEFLDSMANLRKKYGFYKFLLKDIVLALNFYYLILRKVLGKLKKLFS